MLSIQTTTTSTWAGTIYYMDNADGTTRRLLTVAEVARELRVTRATAYRWARDEQGERIDLYNFRRSEWRPAVEAAAIPEPARIYYLRSTFASNALAANVTVFELAKIMGTSVRMIEKHYGMLLDGAGAGIAARLDAFDGRQDQSRQRNMC